jgi:hypothetical protein
MAIHSLLITDLYPDTSGFAYPKPSVVADVNDLYPHERLALKDGGTGGFTFRFRVLKNYVSSPEFFAVWVAGATSGVVRLQLSYRTITTGSMDPSTHEQTLAAVTPTTNPTSLGKNETSLGTPTAANFAVDDWVFGLLQRIGADASDTLMVDAEFEGVIFQWSDV